MSVLDRSSQNMSLLSWIEVRTTDASTQASSQPKTQRQVFDLLHPLRAWLNGIQIDSAKQAHFLCKLIPAQCPFERDIKLGNRTLFHIPPLCKLNPLYEEVVALRFRALCFLADECGEDISPYC
ncbi:Mo-dependent nitrogenase C-terminal domain-containing protein [Geitlerinema sp. PCC 9228]|jgi:hypothetical protein|uniref:Mo-dependent nitrogenase C-terminal domain-containing protein n=1 Tax=Geitlerinema sp. PCC 9228 TaxID=111611 RepID=UPI0008F9CB0D|nr:Mo-dependent nitrogenase C-terminal domain-containing protein [Geitlerinema sp. PCC 9228]